MKYLRDIILFIIIINFLSCKEEKELLPSKKSLPNKIVLISVNAPKKYRHLIKQDSIGKIIKDSLGPKAFRNNNGFSYLDYMNTVQTWIPKPNVHDTITIECYNDYLELSTYNFFTAINETFLVKNGDTVIFNYEHNIPKARITNREVNDIELNYNRHRHKTLFNNKYTSHHLIFVSLFLNENIEDYEQNSISHYQQAKQDFNLEVQFLDSLVHNNVISWSNYLYRIDALHMLMEKHKDLKSVKKWMKQNKSANEKEKLEQSYGFNLAHTDSLMKFSFFRDYLIDISQYELNFIEENNVNSGSYYIDSRIRFDSILKDKRFNQTAKNFLLFHAYNGIGQNFRVKDKEAYFEKLQNNTTNPTQLDQLKKDFKLDFSKSNMLVLSDIRNDTLTYDNLLQRNKGKWLYIDFWASWCKPCIETIPASHKLKKDLEAQNLEFIYLSLNDKKDNWKKAIEINEIYSSQNYFIENGNSSKVIEELGIKTIPHYLIYDPNGTLVNGFANRPGQGAKEQLLKLMRDK